MPESAAEDPGEIVQRGLKHSSRELELAVVTGLGSGRKFLGIGDRGRQGASLIDFLEIVRFVEGKQIYADGRDVGGHRLEQPGGVAGIDCEGGARSCRFPEQVEVMGKGAEA